MEHAKGVVQRQVEGRGADQGRQPGDRLGCPPARIAIESLGQPGKDVLQETMPDLHRVARLDRRATSQAAAISQAERPQGLMPLLVAQTGWARPTGPRAASRPSRRRLRPRRSSTVILTRAQVTSVVISGPNLSGTRVLIGRK